MASKRKASFGTPSLFKYFWPIQSEEEPSGVEPGPRTYDDAVSRTSLRPTTADEAESELEMDVRGPSIGEQTGALSGDQVVDEGSGDESDTMVDARVDIDCRGGSCVVCVRSGNVVGSGGGGDVGSGGGGVGGGVGSDGGGVGRGVGSDVGGVGGVGSGGGGGCGGGGVGSGVGDVGDVGGAGSSGGVGSDSLNDIGCVLKPTMSVETVTHTVRSLTARQKYCLLTEHFVPTCSFSFPKTFDSGCNRSFQVKWLKQFVLITL